LIASVTEQIEKAGAVVMPAGAVKPARGSKNKAGPAAAAPNYDGVQTSVGWKKFDIDDVLIASEAGLPV
jgi:hypothetical protein